MNRFPPPPSASLTDQPIAQPATEDEAIACLHEYLTHALDSTWELYTRPFLNGDFPALAALHPIQGLTLFGVFPWNLRDYRYEQRGRYLRYFQRTASGQHPVLSPVRQIEHCAENLINLYLPHVGESIARDRRLLTAFQVALYFPEANTHAAQIFAPIAPGRGIVFGQDAVIEQDLARILPAAQRPGTRALPQDWIDSLHLWLAPPMHRPATGRAIALTDEQKRHVTPAPGRHQRLHGVAGSGKTLVIAQRAANLAATGKRVMVVTFNATLWQYIRQLANQTAVEFPWQNIEFHHFHGFCKNFLTENSVEWPRTSNRTPKQALDDLLPTLVAETFHAQSTTPRRAYDAILIDEGQDFLPSYYKTLCLFLTDNDEVLLVADRKQNLYLRDDSWLNKMTDTKFRGRWREMKQSYRLPPVVATEVNYFAATFFPDKANPDASHTEQSAPDELTLPVSDVEAATQVANSLLRWHNIDTLDTILDKIVHTVRTLIKTHGVKPADIAVLTPNQKEGWTVVTFLEAAGLAVSHILTADDGHPGRKQRRFRKRTFAPDDTRLKVSTIHSFKGWELNTVILITPDDDQYWEEQGPYLLYVAMTRTQQNLIVFNRHPAYREYGRTWSKFHHDTATPTPP
ncbi:MAG: AAA family ATPase [Caldilineaceae bacterium]|nr:AAA family ATPase [Caldilineaceae bacterium]